ARAEGLIHARPFRSVAHRGSPPRLGGGRPRRVALRPRRGRPLRASRRGHRPAARRGGRRGAPARPPPPPRTRPAPRPPRPPPPWARAEGGGRRGAAREPPGGGGRLSRGDCSRAEIARVASAPPRGEGGPRYPGPCRDLGMAERAWKRPPAVRLRIPAGEVVVE